MCQLTNLSFAERMTLDLTLRLKVYAKPDAFLNSPLQFEKQRNSRENTVPNELNMQAFEKERRVLLT